MVTTKVQVGPVVLIVDNYASGSFPRVAGSQYCKTTRNPEGFKYPSEARIAAVKMARQILKKALKELGDCPAASVAETLKWKEII